MGSWCLVTIRKKGADFRTMADYRSTITLLITVIISVARGASGASGGQASPVREPVSVSLSILPPENPVAKFIGENHVATCNANDGSRPKWFRGTGEHIREEASQSVSALWRGASSGLQLVISKIDKKDRGEYCCRLPESKQQCFELTVKEPIRFLDTPIEQIAQEGSNFVIKCEVTGDPLPIIQWKVRGHPTQGAHYEQIADGLSIRNVTAADSGQYECVAIQMSEQLTSQEVKNISLRVLHTPKFLPTTSPQKVFAYLGGEVNLTCEVSADPEASFQWFSHWDRQQLTEPLAKKVINLNNKSILKIKVSNATLFGKYRCKATNNRGDVSREVILAQGNKPHPPQRVKLFSVDAMLATLTVTGHPKNPENETLGYRVQLTNTADNRTIERDCIPMPCTLSPLSPGTNFSTRVATRGLAGLSDWAEGPALRTLVPVAGAPGVRDSIDGRLPALLALAAYLLPQRV